MINTDTISANTQNGLMVYQVRIDGEPLSDAIESISAYMEVNRIPGAKIIFSEGGNACSSNFDLTSQSRFYPGKGVEIWAGYGHADRLLFKGMIIRHTIRNRNYANKKLRGASLVLECRHDLIKAGLLKSNALFHSVSDSDIISQLLKKYIPVQDVQSTEYTFPELVQYQQSDWEFVLHRARANGFVVVAENESTRVWRPDMAEKPKLSLKYPKSILDLDAELDAQHQVNQVTYNSWDSDNQQPASCSDDRPVESTNITDVTGSEEAIIFHTGDMPDTVMQSAVNAQKLRRDLSKKRGRVRCNGTTDVLPGDVISLEGTGSTFDGRVLVTGVRHSITPTEWISDIQFGLNMDEEALFPNPGEQRSTMTGLFIGTVLQIENDPKGSERILVNVPVLNNREGIWARLSVPDAGKERGWSLWPDVNDEVIIGFLQSDPNQPIVLGRLHSAKNPAPYPAESTNKVKGFKTRNGMELVFDEDESSVSLKTQNGNMVRLSDVDEVLELKDQNGNSIKLSNDGIELTSNKDLILKAKGEVKISGNKIKMEAKTEVEMKGKTGLSISTNAIAKIKGNLIKLN